MSAAMSTLQHTSAADVQHESATTIHIKERTQFYIELIAAQRANEAPLATSPGDPYHAISTFFERAVSLVEDYQPTGAIALGHAPRLPTLG